MLNDTADRLTGEAATLIVRGGYNGFSYADLAQQLGIRKASIHYHYPSKVDLVVAVVEQARARIREQIAVLETGSALDQMLSYTGFWKRCIRDQTVPFCLAAVLAAELPSLPDGIATAVRAHFGDLADWMARVLALGVRQGTMRLDAPVAAVADALMAAIYGAMLAARAFGDPDRFDAIVDTALQRVLI